RCRLRSVALLRLSALRMAAGQRDRRGPDSGARSGPPRPTILVHRGAGSASHYPDRRLRSRHRHAAALERIIRAMRRSDPVNNAIPRWLTILVSLLPGVGSGAT